MQHGRPVRDPHNGPVPEAAWAADTAARARSRVAIMTAVRADGLDGGWTMDARIWELMRTHILETIDDHGGPEGTVALELVVDLAQERALRDAPAVPEGPGPQRLHLHQGRPRGALEVERVPRSSPQRIMRWRPDPTDAPSG